MFGDIEIHQLETILSFYLYIQSIKELIFEYSSKVQNCYIGTTDLSDHCPLYLSLRRNCTLWHAFWAVNQMTWLFCEETVLVLILTLLSKVLKIGISCTENGSTCHLTVLYPEPCKADADTASTTWDGLPCLRDYYISALIRPLSLNKMERDEKLDGKRTASYNKILVEEPSWTSHL